MCLGDHAPQPDGSLACQSMLRWPNRDMLCIVRLEHTGWGRWLGALAGLLKFGGLLDGLENLCGHLLESPHLVEVGPRASAGRSGSCVPSGPSC